MPAITADTLALPRLAAAAGRDRAVKQVTTAPSGVEGEGFPVRRAFAGVDLRDLDPFIHMDQMGSVEYGPYEPRGTDWHPHRGFETVTYILDGAFQHQDSHGGGGLIADGATQWMTAGRGILHIETPPEELVVSGGRFHGVQLWVNLPSSTKMAEPRYQNLEGGQVGLVTTPDAGALLRVIAGDLGGHAGPGSTHTPVTLVHATVQPGAEAVVPWDPQANALAYALEGAGTVGAERAPLQAGQLAVLAEGDQLRLAVPSEARAPLEVLLLGGRPLREAVAAYGPFVMNTRAQLVQAVEDFHAGRLGTVPPGALQPYRGPRR